MRRTYLIGTALGAALFGLAAPAVQAQDYHRRMPPAPPQRQEPPLRAAAPTAEMRPGATQGPLAWLKEAEQATRRGQLAEANDLLERAETRILTRATPAPMADQPMRGAVLEHSAAARAALGARNRGGALEQIDLAMRAAAGAGMDAATGASGAPRPAESAGGLRQGGRGRFIGPGMNEPGRTLAPPASATLHDQGTAGTSVAHADHLTPPALPPRQVVRAQSAQAPANSMTEPQTAAPGQRLPVPASPNVAPPGASAMPGTRSGSTTPMQGRTGGGPTATPNAAGTGGGPNGGITGAPPAGGGGSAGR